MTQPPPKKGLLRILEDEGLGCGVAHRYARRDAVFQEGDPTESFAVVKSGRVKLVCARASGKETILEFVGPGEMLCAGAVWAEAPYCCSAIAEADTEVVHIPREAVDDATRKWPPAARSMLDQFSDRSMTLCQRVGETTCGRVDQRVASTLVHFAHKARPQGEHPASTGRLTRQDIADLCGTTVESAIRTMRTFEKRGWIAATDEGIEVLNQKALETLIAE